MQEADHSVRLKVSNLCQLSCSFCHNEGTELPSDSKFRSSIFNSCKTKILPPLLDVNCDEQLLEEISCLKKLGINEIHLTGGEPTTNRALPVIINYLSGKGFIIKMTSNGQYNTGYLQELRAQGLKGINFSVSSFDPGEFLQTQVFQSQEWALRTTNRLRESIQEAESLGIDVKINTVVNDQSDYGRVDSLRRFCGENNITLVLLNNIYFGKTAEDIVFDYIQAQGGELVRIEEYGNNSKGKKIYYLPNGQRIDAKYFRPCYPGIICDGCENRGRETCLEKFYGIRLELRNELYVRLCVQKSNERTLMRLNDFLVKGVYNSL